MHTRQVPLFIVVIASVIVLPILGSGLVAARQTEPVTLYRTVQWPIQTLDPQLASDAWSLNTIGQLFVSLVDIHPETSAPVPELASAWTTNDDQTIWTFTLRNDVPWIRWMPASQEADILRMVTAADVAYGIQRACDPRLGAYYTSMVASIIQGCDKLASQSADSVTDADYEWVQVRVVDDTTLQIELQHPAAYILTMLSMPVFRPVPREVIEEHGAFWTEAGTIVTNGAFVLDEWVPGVRHTLRRSPHLPTELQGPGNIERMSTVVIEEVGTAFDLYLDYQTDASSIPQAADETLLQDPAIGTLHRGYNPLVGYAGFAHDKAPFDNVHVRRAFASAFDRDRIGASYRTFVPMIHFTPPGMFGAPPINEVGVGFDPDYAREQLALAGYPNCEGMPPIRLIITPTWRGVGNLMMEDYESVLGCDASVLKFEEQDFQVLIGLIDPNLAPEDRPHIWFTAWGPDYPDANNWIGDVLSCAAQNAFKRPCSEIDDLIVMAATETDLVRRVELYREIEERFFGPAGDFPLAPIMTLTSYSVTRAWYDGPFETDGIFGAAHYDWYTIDQAAQLAARGP